METAKSVAQKENEQRDNELKDELVAGSRALLDNDFRNSEWHYDNAYSIFHKSDQSVSAISLLFVF